MNKVTLNCTIEKLPPDLCSVVEVLSEEYPLKDNAGLKLEMRKSSDQNRLVVKRDGDKVIIEYGRLSAAVRGLGLALSGLEKAETLQFDMFGIMLDCSRNAVMTVDYLKKWLRRMALMGYNMLMLYTEDTYTLEDEPYFGYMRGAYTFDEIREIDTYALALGIELIPCIQTLGHMEQILRWEAYRNTVGDTSSVMLVDCDETMKLISKMLDFWSSAVTTRRIHIGMDETHDLGRGKFLDKFGYERGFDIFNRHLGKVEEMCEKRGLKPMIWSDMYFRMGNETYNYYDKNTVIPEEVKQAIPQNTELVYWDYYHKDKEFYDEWIKRHRDLGHEPLMGSGIWTWAKLWYDHKVTMETVTPCLDACVESGVNEIFFTMWGDDGAYCDFDSSLAGMAWTAEKAFADKPDTETLEQFFGAVCGGSYMDHIMISDAVNYDYDEDFKFSALLWDDPLMGKYYNEMTKNGFDLYDTIVSAIDKNIDRVTQVGVSREAGDTEFALALLKFAGAKLSYSHNLRKAKGSGDTRQLAGIMERDIPALVSGLTHFSELFRNQWLKKNKPFGLDIIQVRLAGQVERYHETARQISEFLAGNKLALTELECPKLSGNISVSGSYGNIATSSVIRW